MKKSKKATLKTAQQQYLDILGSFARSFYGSLNWTCNWIQKLMLHFTQNTGFWPKILISC